METIYIETTIGAHLENAPAPKIGRSAAFMPLRRKEARRSMGSPALVPTWKRPKGRAPGAFSRCAPTIVSYLVANPNRDPIIAAHQQLTRQWWEVERQQYQCVTSVEVVREASLGDVEMRRRRSEGLATPAILAVDDSARGLARAIIAEKILPPAAASDAIHAVVASQHGVNILLTWNCRHLANPHLLARLRAFIAAQRLVLPEVCTPVEIMGE